MQHANSGTLGKPFSSTNENRERGGGRGEESGERKEGEGMLEDRRGERENMKKMRQTHTVAETR